MKNNGKQVAPAVPDPSVNAADESTSTVNRMPSQRRIWGGDGFRPLALAGLTVVLIGLCVWLALPFLPALAWGVAFAIIAWPLHVWLRCKFGYPQLAALATTFAVLILIVVPGLLVTNEVLRETNSAAERMRTEAAGA